MRYTGVCNVRGVALRCGRRMAYIAWLVIHGMGVTSPLGFYDMGLRGSMGHNETRASQSPGLHMTLKQYLFVSTKHREHSTMNEFHKFPKHGCSLLHDGMGK